MGTSGQSCTRRQPLVPAPFQASRRDQAAPHVRQDQTRARRSEQSPVYGNMYIAKQSPLHRRCRRIQFCRKSAFMDSVTSLRYAKENDKKVSTPRIGKSVNTEETCHMRNNINKVCLPVHLQRQAMRAGVGIHNRCEHNPLSNPSIPRDHALSRLYEAQDIRVVLQTVESSSGHGHE